MHREIWEKKKSISTKHQFMNNERNVHSFHELYEWCQAVRSKMQLAGLNSRVFDGKTNHAIMTVTMSSARSNNEKINDIYENYRISSVHVQRPFRFEIYSIHIQWARDRYEFVHEACFTMQQSYVHRQHHLPVHLMVRSARRRYWCMWLCNYFRWPLLCSMFIGRDGL